jgi:hypothetical protein
MTAKELFVRGGFTLPITVRWVPQMKLNSPTPLGANQQTGEAHCNNGVAGSEVASSAVAISCAGATWPQLTSSHRSGWSLVFKDMLSPSWCFRVASRLPSLLCAQPGSAKGSKQQHFAGSSFFSSPPPFSPLFPSDELCLYSLQSIPVLCFLILSIGAPSCGVTLYLKQR